MNQIKLNKKYQPLFRVNPELFYYFLYGGRAGKKSWTSSLVLAISLLYGKGNCLYCRQYMTNVPDTVVPQFLDKIKILNIEHLLNINKNSITNKKNGNTLWFRGLESSEGTAEANLKGIKSLETVVLDQFQQVKQKNFDSLLGTIRDKGLNLKLICCLNPTNIKSWQYQRFFKGLQYDYTGIIDNKYYCYSSYKEAEQYLSPAYLQQIQNLKKSNLIKYQNQYLGKWLANSENTLFTQQMINAAKEHYQEKLFKKYIISIDPAVTVSQDSDQTGICVAGKDQDNHYVVLQSISKKWSPQQWCMIVKDMKHKYPNASIIAQKNNGGLLIQEALHNVGLNSVKLVTATKSKILRADDIVVLFQQNKVHFKRQFNQLCYQCLTYSGDPKDKSPNELDAMVWALKQLSQGSNSGSLYIE